MLRYPSGTIGGPQDLRGRRIAISGTRGSIGFRIQLLASVEHGLQTHRKNLHRKEIYIVEAIKIGGRKFLMGTT